MKRQEKTTAERLREKQPPPNGKPKKPTNTEPTPWPEPLPLDSAPDVEPFPTDVFPPPLKTLVQEIAFAVNCPTDYAAIPLLAFAGGAIGNARHLAITNTHRQSACLFAAYCGRPGTTKSAPLKILRRPFDRVQAQLFLKWQGEMSEWQESQEEGKRRRRKRNQGESQEGEGEKASGEKAGPKPILKRVIVSDSTTESLAITLSQNPRGVVMVRPELTALMSSMNQYKGGKGQDRQVYLALWDGDNIVIDRKSDKDRGGAPLFASNPFTSIIGTLQPDVLCQLRGDAGRGLTAADDGFFDRWLCAYPAEVPAIGEQWRDVSQESLLVWDDVIDALLGLEMVQEAEGFRPFFVNLSGCGRKAWEAFTQRHANEINNPDFPTYLFGPWSKLKGYCGRLALIVHYLRWACGEVGDEKAVDGESVNRAARLVEYFKSHAMKVYAALDADPKIASARKVFQWIMGQGQSSFARKDCYQALKGTFRTIEDLDAVLSVLLKRSLIRLQPPQDHPGRGPKPGPTYDVSPHAEANCGNYRNCRNTPEENRETTTPSEEVQQHNSPDSHNSHNSHNSGDREVFDV